MNLPGIPLWQRGLGAIGLLAALLLYHSPGTLGYSPWTTVLVSVLFLGGASLLTRAWLAIALACAFFCWLQVLGRNQESTLDFYFLTLAILSSAYSLYVLSDRFRQRITATRADRWERRANHENQTDQINSASDDNTTDDNR